MSFTNFLQSISMFSTLMSRHSVVFQSVKQLFTSVIMSQRPFRRPTWGRGRGRGGGGEGRGGEGEEEGEGEEKNVSGVHASD